MMLKNENIICISSIDWDFIWQGHQEIMSSLAKDGNRVLFIENTGVRMPGIRDAGRIKKRLKNWLKGFKGIRKEAENLYVFSPLVLPFPYARFSRWINSRLILPVLYKWMKALDFSDPIVWTFLPTPLSLKIIDGLSRKLSIYYCIDNFSVSSVSANKVRKSEERLLKKVDLVFVTSAALYQRCREYNDRIYTFPFAVNFEQFQEARLQKISFLDEFEKIKRPVIGYVGGIHKWIDQALIKLLAERHPGYSFVFIGPVQTDITLLSGIKNIYFSGNKDHNKLPFYIKSFDVCIIPYLITDYTKNVYPTKLNEYLAMGKPVISTPLPEVIEFNSKYGNILYLAENADVFDRCIEKAVAYQEAALADRRIEAARENSWQNRILKMSTLIEDCIRRKRLEGGVRWKEDLFYFYAAARRRFLKSALVCLLLYALFFKTAFIWFLAEPLKIQDVPGKADSIVVFGAGVGETGSPGKSTIERARYAVQLYKQKHADKIIFSTGYSYVHSDADNMRFIAHSMGVPYQDIILEKQANNAYENVIFTKKILDERGWQSVLLVSSPYNMRRVRLIFDKWAKDKKVSYVPPDKSQFYDRSFGVKLEQIRAIMHEYFGILYYWFKGYI